MCSATAASPETTGTQERSAPEFRFVSNTFWLVISLNFKQKIFNEYGACLTFNNIDASFNSSDYPAKVQGVGLENSLRIKLNKDLEEEDIHYRVFISEVGTTVSKVTTNKSLSLEN